MADLTFDQLQAALPTGAVVLSNGTTALTAGVYINVGKFIEQVTNSMSDEGVTELAVKLIKAASKAQATQNALPNATQMNAFPEPSYGSPRTDASGNVTSNITASVIGVIPLNINSISANV